MLELRKKLSTTEDTGDTEKAIAENCIQRYLYPEPRVRMGSLLGRNRAATACMDLSDGLAEAVHQIAEASGVGAIVDSEQLPLDPGARRWFQQCGGDPMHEALIGGDDYELLFAVRPRRVAVSPLPSVTATCALTRIGTCTAETSILLRHDGADRPLPHGFQHFNPG